MSIFDPHSLYVHHQKSTKKGQIIQKKPQKRLSAISKEEIPRSIMVLKTYGYTVSPPGQTTIHPAGAFVNTTVYQIPQGNVLQLSFNNVWNIVKNSFADLLSIPLANVTNAYVAIGITSINIPVNDPPALSQIVYESDYFSNTVNTSNPCDILYQAYSEDKVLYLFSQQGGFGMSKKDSQGDYIIGGHITYEWSDLVLLGQLDTDVNLFTLSNSANTGFGEVTITLCVNAIVNYAI